MTNFKSFLRLTTGMLAIIVTLSFMASAIFAGVAYYQYVDDANGVSPANSIGQNIVPFDPASRSLVQLYSLVTADVTSRDTSKQWNTQSKQLVFLCTGFFVDTRGTIVTADHCINDTEQADGFREFYGKTGMDIGAAKVTDRVITAIQNGSITQAALRKPSKAQVLESGSPDSDEAVLRAKTIQRASVPLPIADHKPAIKEIVQSIGYPGDSIQSYMQENGTQLSVESLDIAKLKATIYQGPVTGPSNGIGSSYDDAVAYRGMMQKGMSGGPTVNSLGEVVGVNSASYNDPNKASSFTKLSNLQAKLNRLGIQTVHSVQAATEATTQAIQQTSVFDIIMTTDMYNVQVWQMLALSVMLLLIWSAIRPFKRPAAPTATQPASSQQHYSYQRY